MKTLSQIRNPSSAEVSKEKSYKAFVRDRARDRILHHYNKEQSRASVAEEVELTPEELHEARVKIVKARIRGGKVQRRKKVSNVKGYTIRGGKLTRMSPKEKLDRKRGARKGKIKRKAKLARALIKRKRSLRKRASLGL